MNRPTRAACLVVPMLAAAAAAAPPATKAIERGDGLAAAKAYVEKSDRYLHHGRLRRGMTGYGLTVFAGTTIERFDVEILSVMTKWGPHQDVILARCSGKRVDKLGIAAGMSGSPIFIQDPRDKKFKIVGALAYGWQFPKEAICGVQPITQMLAMDGVLPGSRQGDKKATRPVPPRASGEAPAAFLAAALTPRKVDFSGFTWPKRPARGRAGSGPRMVPLTTPLMVSGASARTIARAGKDLEPLGIVPVQAGGVGGAEAGAAKNTKLAPGASVSIPLASGDADWAAIGTVTDVVGKRVLILGHSIFGDGDVELPMGTAYIHTVVGSAMRSFKLGSSLKVTGAAVRDEYVGVSGLLGKSVAMVPMTISVHWAGSGRKEQYKYGLSRYRTLTGRLAGYMVFDALVGWHELPEFHTVRYSVSVDFGKLGRIETENVSSDSGAYDLVSDVTRPIGVLLSNPLGPPPQIKGIDVKVRVEDGSRVASILDFSLDGRVYKPGDTATGTVTVRPHRKGRQKIPVRFALPEDLPPGRHTLTVCDSQTSMQMLQREMPQRFHPRTVPELYEALQRVLTPRADRLYVRLPLQRGGLAVAARELPDLPESKAQIIAEAARIDAKPFSDTLVRTVNSPYVLYGSATAGFEVRREPNEFPVNQPKEGR